MYKRQDLKSYVTGKPTPTISFNPVPTGDISGAVLNNGILTWSVPDTITTDTSLALHFRATNSIGHTDASLSVNVVTDAAPVWQTMPDITTGRDVPVVITISVVEGDTEDFDFGPYVTGSPRPTLSLLSLIHI